jgi:uncharacterized protein (TIGR02466 family)
MRYVKHEWLFPTCIVYSDNANLVNAEMVEFAKTQSKEHAASPFIGNCVSTLTTLHQILELDIFSEVKKEIVKSLNYYCTINHIDNTDVLYITTSWINYYDKGGYQDLHLHPHSLLSGIFYLKAESKKDLYFQAPWHFFQPIPAKVSKTTLENSSILNYESKVGRCYIFPSHLMHQTTPAESERISIAFNISYKRS